MDLNCDDVYDDRLEEYKGSIPGETEKKSSSHSFQMMPEFNERFRAATVKELIHGVMNDELGGKKYTVEDAEMWTKNIATSVRNKVKELGFKRYKYVVQVVLGEQHGAGIKIGSRCLWDADTDHYASDVFINESIFCMTVVFAIYFY
ncbi:tctex1 domain-containing protein 2-like isoform X2 [Zootermopsis nevadensis]|uniref:Tctex1 domain-containing protein 2 n=1 Tax=Zootermopsis nevadensis TaxID=136037 RepID=A0A067RI58_ZOONE|nr:tctex1 domain-containing protein 2-like isoform X2 [Zootermopsis nevadensis]XP_021920870.1 tctex1 domain-containing protein 2-like isoform X2 [Zootermopsis nevadensis]XP_021920871.1 tctex1 domain-containing protein 2-like isoform X2 [Zootermopsis nevadensis]KDR18945.1 Tctex1 domain-containing protein 2 [Zootermopsis nevadensis]